MGLDMYLQASKYFSRYEHTPEAERKVADAIIKAAGMDAWQRENGGFHVTATAIYWRKANQIHRWFVENVQGGEDDCGRYYVSREKLVELRDTAAKVLASIETVPDMVSNGSRLLDGKWEPILEVGEQILDPAVAQELLPAASGFFFGGTEYDQWYVEDIKHTLEGLNRVLALDGPDADNGWVDFHYESSW